MPCSCQKNKTTTETITAVTGKAPLTIDMSTLLKLNTYTKVLTKAESDSYDFTPTTEPLDTCAYCALKHISLAALLQLRGDYFSAAGLMQLAGYHYNTANTELSKLCKDTAKLFITKPLSVNLLTLLTKAMEYPADGDSKLVIPSTFPYDPVLAMVHLAAAQALIYTEVFYLQLNKSYAIGLLVLSALCLQLNHRDTARDIREVWKVVLLIKLANDKPYKDAQLMLLKCKGLILYILKLSNNTLGANDIPVN